LINRFIDLINQLIDLIYHLMMNHISTLFIKHLLDKPNKQTTSKLLLELTNTLLSPSFQKNRYDLVGCCGSNIDLLVDAFFPLITLLQQQTILWESDGNQQKQTSHSIAKILQQVLKDDFHRVNDSCSNYDAKTHSCRYENPLIPGTDQHTFDCAFHEGDSLASHLVVCMLICGFRSIQLGNDSHTTGLIMLTGLLHDLQKMTTVQTFEFKGSLMTGFPAHGEFGMITLRCLWNPMFTQWISENEWSVMCTTIGKHMCGYHGQHVGGAIYKRELLSMESKEVKQSLSVLRIGDHFAAIPSNRLFEDPVEFMKGHETFIQSINSTNNFKQFLEKWKFRTDKRACFLIGTSGSGKSWLARMISTHFKTAHLERDCCMTYCLIGIYQRFVGEQYKMLYQIYNLQKEIAGTIRRAKGKLSKNIAAQLEADQQKLIRLQNEWNNTNPTMKTNVHQMGKDVIDIAEKIKVEFNRRIVMAIDDPEVEIILIDTMMNMFPNAIEMYVSNRLKNIWIHHIHLTNLTERLDGNNIGGTIAEQLQVSGKYDVVHPTHHQSMKAKDLKLFSSVSTDLNSIDDHPKALHDSPFRPNDVMSCCRTPSGNFGYDDVLERLKKFTTNPVPNVGPNPVPIVGPIVGPIVVPNVGPNIGSNVGPNVGPIIGQTIDPLTKDMNIVQFYVHMIKLYKNPEKIKASFLELGFFHKMILRQSPTSDEEMEKYLTKISKFTIRLKQEGIIKKEFSVEDLTDPNNLEKVVGSIIVINYMELWGERFWKNRWAKESRGVVLFRCWETDKVQILNFKLPRGAEVITGMHKSAGIGETQDIREGMVDILDDEQQETVRLLMPDKQIRADLTSKVDGSLCCLTSYTGNAMKIMRSLVGTNGSDIAIWFMERSFNLSRGKRIIIPSTQGTAWEGGFMGGYMVTSMLVGTGIASREQLEKIDTMMECLQTFGDQFIERVLQFRFYDELSESNSLMFEAVCKNGMGLFGDHRHTELAIHYPNDYFQFLGMSLADRRFYIPHTIYTTKNKLPNGFIEPLWWKIEKSNQIEQMMNGITELIRRKISKEQYLERFPPSNSHQQDIPIDYEGWVLMKWTNNLVDSDHRIVVEDTGFPLTIYSKIKTEDYYKGHKFHKKNIPYLIELAQTAGDSFQVARKVADLLGENNIPLRIRSTIPDILHLLDPTQYIWQEMVKKIGLSYLKGLAESINSTTGTSSTKIRKDPLKGFENRPYDVQCRQIISCSEVNFGQMLIPIFHKQFPEIDLEYPELSRILIGVVMNLTPWNSETLEKKITELDPQHPFVKDLMTACLGFDHSNN